MLGLKMQSRPIHPKTVVPCPDIPSEKNDATLAVILGQGCPPTNTEAHLSTHMHVCGEVPKGTFVFGDMLLFQNPWPHSPNLQSEWLLQWHSNVILGMSTSSKLPKSVATTERQSATLTCPHLYAI